MFRCGIQLPAMNRGQVPERNVFCVVFRSASRAVQFMRQRQIAPPLGVAYNPETDDFRRRVRSGVALIS